MFQRLKTIWKPELFHGPSRHEHFFEGWYYRFVDLSSSKSVIVIPALYVNRKKERSYACIQIMDSDTHTSCFHQFKQDSVTIDKHNFDLSISSNRFTTEYLTLDIDEPGRRVKGTIRLTNLRPWPVTLFSPGAMGWYAFMPFMQCYHGVLSFDHRIEGRLVIDDREYDFSPGRGYLEKDWGHRFPEGYLWLQSNQFPSAGSSVFVSIARIPWIRGAFRGLLAALLHNGRLYRFTTYTGASLDTIRVDEQHIRLSITDHKYRLDIEALRKPGGLLYGPDGQAFRKNILESLNGEVTATLLRHQQKSPLFRETAFPAAMEVNGRLDHILNIR